MKAEKRAMFASRPQAKFLGLLPRSPRGVVTFAGFSVLRQSASRKAPSRKQGAQKTVRQQSTGTEQRGLLKDARELVVSKSTRFYPAINRHFLDRSGLRSAEALPDDREPAVVGRDVRESECWIPHAKVAKTEPFNCQSIPATGGLCRVPSSLSKD